MPVAGGQELSGDQPADLARGSKDGNTHGSGAFLTQ